MLICYYLFAAGILIFQFLVLLEAGRHFNYVRRKWPPKGSTYQPRAMLIVPCKGLETEFSRNISALFQQNYPDYSIRFVLDHPDDHARQPLESIILQQRNAGNPISAKIVYAGKAIHNSQKVHNLLTVCRQAPDNIEILAFVDADACPPPHFLSSMIHPLRRDEVGASTGYRWYVPADYRLSSLTLSAMNAYFASLLGPHQRNPVWGGAMAFKRSFFYQAGIDQLWKNALSDDYAVTYAVQQQGLEVYFVPACFIASYEGYSWCELFEFTRRQFIITWCCNRKLWYLAFAGFSQYLLAFWLGMVVTGILWYQHSPHTRWAAIFPIALYIASFLKALLRQSMIMRILARDRNHLIIPALIDLFGQPIIACWTWLCIGSAWRKNIITWRGNRYRMLAIDQTERLD